MGGITLSDKPLQVTHEIGKHRIEGRFGRWDGDTIWQTKQCGSNCLYFREAKITCPQCKGTGKLGKGRFHPIIYDCPYCDGRGNVNEETAGIVGVCTKGVAWKVIVKIRPPHKLRTCIKYYERV